MRSASLVVLAAACSQLTGDSRSDEGPSTAEQRVRRATAAVRRMEAERQELTRSLLAVVEQASAPVEARRQAILLLGQLATPKAVAWLNGHLNLYLPKAAYRCDDDRFKEYPALYALGDAGWAAVPVLLDRLAARPCNREQLLVMAEVFRRTCGHETARLLIKARAEQNKAGPLAANTARLEPLLNE